METAKAEPKTVSVEVIKTPQGFADAYNKLCSQYGFRVVVSPVWVATNHNSFEMVNQYTIGAMPKEETVV